MKTATKRTPRQICRKIIHDRISYAFVAPYILLFILFTVVPVVTSLVLSFTNFNILEPPQAVGLTNYIKLFMDDEIFLIAIRNTFILAVITGPVSFMMSLLLAWLISEIPAKLRALVTLVFYAPSISGNAYLIWKVMFSGDSYGYVNGILLKLGVITTPIQFFNDPAYMMPFVIFVVLWMSMGTSFLTFIAGFQGMDRSLYEAGAMDGIRNRWQELWYITLPTLRPQLMLGAILSITNSFNIGPVITGLVGYPSTDYAVHTIMHHLDDYGTIRFEMGYASAIATLLFIIMVAANAYVKRLIAKVGT